MDVIKNIAGHLLDWASGIANIPAALTALGSLKGEVGKIVEISAVDESGIATGFEAVEKPNGADSGENATNPWTTAAIGQLVGILNQGHYRSDQTDAIATLEAMLLSAETPKEGVVQVGSSLFVYDPDTAVQDGADLHIT